MFFAMMTHFMFLIHPGKPADHDQEEEEKGDEGDRGLIIKLLLRDKDRGCLLENVF